jgi:tetratricopeptide (TPR) repeat protein
MNSRFPRRLVRCAIAVALFSLAATSRVLANRESEALRARGSVEIYNLDRDQATATFREAIAADPQDSAAYRGLATSLWLSITFRRGNMTVDDYIGRVTKPNAAMAPPPPETAAAFREALDKAIALARARLDANPRDPEAHYQLGAALGLRASYIATVDGSAFGAFRAAREAYEEHERVLSLDSRRKDAALIVGTYRYVVSVLALPVRLMAYVAGFGGGKELGIQMIEQAAAYSGDNEQDARFALILIYNREKQYDKALKELALLRDKYPRNRLLWFESGATSLRAGRAGEAERFLGEGLTRFEADSRPRMFGEDALSYYKRGTARAVLGRPADAQQDLAKALALEGRDWVHGRTRLELGKLALKSGNRPAAREHFEATVKLCTADNDPVAVEEARQLLK